MEPRFVNHVVLDKPTMREFVRATFSPAAYAADIIFMVLLAAYCVVSAILRLGLPVVVITGAGAVFFLFYPAILRARTVRRTCETQRLMNGGRDAERFTEFGERIRLLGSNKSETFFDYAQVTRIFDTKRLLVLRVGKHLGVVVGKDGFTTGTFGEFIDFLRAKCPGARIRYR